MRGKSGNLIWLGVAAGTAYWVIESVIHTFVFRSGPLISTLIAEHDPNELWMRLLLSAMFVGFGWIADRSVRAERRLREDAHRLNRLLRYVDSVKQEVVRTGGAGVLSESSPGAPNPSPATAPGGQPTATQIQDLAVSEDDIGALTRTLQELSASLDSRFQELYVLLQLTHEINKGLLLDEALEQAYLTLRTVIPYDRLSVALLEDGGRVLRSRWVHSNCPQVHLGCGYAASIAGSSLQGIILSGEPRIINDLEGYLAEHPASTSTQLMVSEGIRASLTCPLVSLGRPIGFLFFSSRSQGAYQDQHVVILKLIAGHLSVVVEKGILYQQVLQEKEKSESLLLNVMPLRIANRLRAGEATIVETISEAGVLFADIVNFTDFARRFPPETVVGVLQEIFTRIDRRCDAHGIEKIKTIGDSYMAISYSAGSGDDEHLRHIASLALEILAVASSIRYPDGEPLRVRIGLHSGPVVAGVIGQKKFAYDIWGDTVNVASRMQSTGEPGQIHVSARIFDRLRGEFRFECRGEIDIKGKGKMTTYFLKSKSDGMGN